MFLIYFLMNSLVFLGQDLSVSRQENGSWKIYLAEHYQSDRNQFGETPANLNHSRQNCSHRHQGNEVHICLDHHKFLGAFEDSALPGDGSLRLHSPAPPDRLIFFGYDFYHHPVTQHGHDPGPVLSPAASSSILLL